MRTEGKKTLIWNEGRAYFLHPRGQWFDLGYMTCRRNTERWCQRYEVEFVEAVPEMPKGAVFLGHEGFEYLEF